MKHAFRYLSFAAFISVILFFLLRFDGMWRLNFSGIEVSLPTSIGIISVIFLLLCFSIIVLAIVWLWQMPQRALQKRKERHIADADGYMSRAFMLLGTGDFEQAQKLLAKVHKNVPHHSLPVIMDAQISYMRGDHDAAHVGFRKLSHDAADTQTRLFGQEGLYYLAVQKKDYGQALSLAATALDDAPNTPWALRALFETAARGEDWQEAETALQNMLRAKAIRVAEKQKYDAMICVAKIEHRLSASPPPKTDDIKSLLKYATRTLKLQPHFIPLLALTARIYAQINDIRHARKILIHAWAHHPHPDLADAWLYCYRDQPALTTFNAARALIKQNPDHIESHIMRARLAIGAQKWAIARNLLIPYIKDETATQRIYMLMGDIESGNGHDGKAREWVDKARRAAFDAGWYSEGHRLSKWQAVCPISGKFGVVHWHTPTPQLAPLFPAIKP